MIALTKIKAAGFVVELEGMDLVIEPFSKLTQPQIGFLKSHKAEIITELEREQGLVEWVEIPPPRNDALSVVCYTPAGNPVTVQARDAGHAAWLLKMNTQPTAKKGATQ